MTIADEIAKEFAKNLAQRRAAARQQLVAAAADTEKAIREKRPRKSDEKSIIEEAHPGEVFVAESDGLGGMVGNPEQVHEQILNALNRRPSAFPYQGLVANAMLDFEKTAETLESHDLHDEADAVRKIAQDLLTVLQRRAGIKKSALDTTPHGTYVTTPDIGGTITMDMPTDLPPPSSILAPPLSDGQPQGTRPSAQPSTSGRPGHVPASSDLSRNAAKLSRVQSAQTALGKLGGTASKLLGVVGLLATAYSAVEDARNGDYGSVWTTIAGAGGGAGVAVAIALATGAGITVAPITAAAGLGLTVAQGIRMALTTTLQDGIKKDLQDLANDISSKLEDSSYDPATHTDPGKKANAEQARKMLMSVNARVGEMLRALEGLEKQSAESPDPGIVGVLISIIEKNNAALADEFEAFKQAGSTVDLPFFRDTLKIGFPQLQSRIKDVDVSVKQFGEEMDKLHAKIKPTVDAIKTQLADQNELAAEYMAKLESGEISGYGIRQELGQQSGSTLKLKSDTDNPAHIKEVQAFLGVPRTGKWDDETMGALYEIQDRWIGFHIDMGKIVDTKTLKGSTVEELKDLDRLWDNRLVAY